MVFSIFRERCSFLLELVVTYIKWGLLCCKEVVLDIKNSKHNKNECSMQTGRIAIVTGGSRGIGVEVVKMLLQLDMEVIIACRTPAAGEKAILQIRESGVTTGKAKVYKLDNASLESVKQFAKEIKRDYEQIHVLINNAAVAKEPYGETEDGFEETWVVNYLSHFLLTIFLLPLLKASGLPQKCSRIVNVTSTTHLVGRINFSNINNKDRYIHLNAYAQSKLAQVIFTKKLQNLLQERKNNVQVYSVHPGLVLTEIYTCSFVWKMKAILRYIFKSPTEGAIPIVYAAVNEAVENSGGVYISNCRASPVNPDVLDSSIQDQLMELSLRQVKLDNSIIN